MTRPKEYQYASQEFDELMMAIMDEANLATRNQAYTTLEGVLRAFRRRLTLTQAIRFANLLPPVARALFISDWNLDEAPVPFATRAAMTKDVKLLREDHNFSPDTAIRDVAVALRKFVDVKQLHTLLQELPEGAVEFWRI